MGAGKHAHSVVANATKSKPNLVKEIFYGTVLGVFGASFWKISHINERRKVEEFYDRLDKGEITVEVFN